MKAAVVRRYGPPEVVRIEEVPAPTAAPGELLVRVTAAAVNSADARIRGIDVPKGFGPLMRLALGFRGPRRAVLGSEFVGVVEETGPGAHGFAVGDRVMGVTGLRGGAHAELVAVPAAGKVMTVPDGLADEEAAGFFFGGLPAAGFLIDRARLRRDERLLVNGATGAVGSAAVQIARHLGARVTAVCGAASADHARALGADEVLDYRAGPVRGTWDVVMDVVGTLPWRVSRPLLADGGRLLTVTPTLGDTIGAGLWPRRDGRRVFGAGVDETKEAMARLVAIYEAGGYRPVVGARFPFERIAEAHRLAGSRHKRGSAVVTFPATR